MGPLWLVVGGYCPRQRRVNDLNSTMPRVATQEEVHGGRWHDCTVDQTLCGRWQTSMRSRRKSRTMMLAQCLQSWLKLAGRYFVEIALALSGSLPILGKFTTLVIQGSLAITLFLSSIIYSIFRIRTSIEKVDELSARVNSLLNTRSPQIPLIATT